MTPREKIPEALNDALGFNLDRVATFYRHGLIRALADYGLTPEQWQIMSIVWGNEKVLTQQDITRLLIKDKHNVSRMIRRLEAKGWLEREQSPEDARAFLIRPTELGANVKDEVPKRLYAYFDQVDTGLSSKEERQLLNLLKKVRKGFRDSLAEELKSG